MRVLLAVALCVATFGASAQLYRWTDDKGRVHITDTPPPPSAKGVKKTGPQGGAPESAAPQQPSGSEPFALQQARKNFPVTLYTVPDCEACTAARSVLNKRGVPFSEVSVTDVATQDDFKKKIGGNTVPAMVVGSTVQKGFEEAAYQRLLDAAGYPATGILPARNQAEPAPAATPGAPSLPKVEPVPPEAPPGPYSPGAAPQPPKKK